MLNPCFFFFNFSAWVVLGKPRSENPKAYTENGFQGHLTKVQVWGRGLDVTNEIQKQVMRSLKGVPTFLHSSIGQGFIMCILI